MALRLALTSDLPLNTSVLADQISAPSLARLTSPKQLGGRENYPQCVLGRRFLLVVALLMGLTALAASIAPRESAVGTREPAATPAPAVPTPAGTSGEPELEAVGGAPETVTRSIDATAPPVRITVREGDTVVLEVSADTLGAVILDGVERIEPVEPESPARMEVLMDEPGSFALRFLESGRRIATVDVRPAA